PPPGLGYYWIYWILGIFLILQMLFVGYQTPRETTWSEFEKMVLAGDVAKLEVINKERVEITLNPEKINPDKYREWKKGQTGPHYYFTIGSVEVFESKLSKLKAAHPDITLPPVKYLTRVNWFQTLLSWLFPILIIVLVWVYIFSRLGGKSGIPGANPFDFGKSKATLFDSKNKTKVTFEDVAGLDEAKVEVREIVEFLKNPEIYTRLGAKIPKGVILIGPPGTGKTLLAKAVAGEAQVPFFNISGSEFVEMFVGVGASRVRDLFKKAKERAPSIIFIDEIDAIGRMRGSAFSLRSNDERESTLNQLLTEMDGFGANTGVIVMAATNRADILDKALLRPGRFDRHIYLELPNLHERIAIFKVHLRPLRLADDIQVELLAAQTPGFSGADIANMCNEAALIAARKGKDKVEMADFADATDRIVAGLEKKSKILSPKEKKIIAYHEAGHATASWYLEHADELVKVSIVPRGRSLGAAWYLPEEHQIITKAQFLDKICAALGGRVAEEIVFGEISSGALDDLEKVTKQAYSMVAFYGLDEKLGPVSFYDSTGKYDQSLQKPYSEATAKLIDEEVRNLVSFAFDRTRKILTEHLDELEAVAQLLLKNEVIFKKDLEVIFQKRHNDQNTADPTREHLKIKD
ncbi:MAG: ATP-dependent metallopeptidase FtsH/Yme1/Tma family protein, partial [Bacteroidetes bacterium]